MQTKSPTKQLSLSAASVLLGAALLGLNGSKAQADNQQADNQTEDDQASSLTVTEDKKQVVSKKPAATLHLRRSTLRMQRKKRTGKVLTVNRLHGVMVQANDKASFESAVNSAPSDGSLTNIQLTADINLGSDRLIIGSGKNIRIVNDNQQRHVYIGNQLRVAGGANLTIAGQQPDGIILTRPQGLGFEQNPENTPLTTLAGWESYWSPIDVVDRNSRLTLKNVKVGGFHLVVTDGEDLSSQAASDLNGSIGDGLSLDGEDIGVVTVTDDASLDMQASVIDDNLIYDYEGKQAGISRASAAALAVRLGANCTMDQHSQVSGNSVLPDQIMDHLGKLDSAGYNAGGILLAGASLVINGGTVANNSGAAGGIFAYDGFEPNTLLELHGAKILNNNGHDWGGGMFLYGADYGQMNAVIDQDTLIDGNAVGDRHAAYAVYLNEELPLMGGGISVSDGVGYNRANTHIVHLKIDGATISHNIANSAGGGIYLDTDGVEIKKATIADNDCRFGMGGGIYVSTAPYKIRLNRAAIYDNHAVSTRDPRTGMPYAFRSGVDSMEVAGSGGGIWLCPTGESDIRITNGIADFNNRGDYGGDDLWNEQKNPGVLAEVSDRALGGSAANWTHDRDLEDYLHPGKKFTGPEIGDNVGLKSHISEDGQALALGLADIKIYGNTGAWGGGVGSNGGVITSLENEPDSWVRDITVKKEWQGDSESDRPDSVTVKLMAKDPADPSRYLEVTSFALTRANNWTYQLKNLPLDVDYSFVEDAIDQNGDGIPDYTEEQGPLVQDHPALPASDTYYYTIKLTNVKNTIPSPGPGPEPITSETIRIIKRWRGDQFSRPAAVSFDVYQVVNGQRHFIKTVVLTATDADATGDWCGSVSGLTDGGVYQLSEEMIDENGDGKSDYRVEEGQLQHVDTENGVDLWQIVFTNSKEAVPPRKPDKPHKPKPNKPRQHKPKPVPGKKPRPRVKRPGKIIIYRPPLAPKKPKTVKLPQTGDSGQAALKMAGLIIGALGIGLIFMRRRKRS